MTLSERVEGLTGPDRDIVDRLDRSGSCWLWTGKLDQRGRGRVWHNGKLKLHHRAVWEILNGPIPEGGLLCHHCDNPQCANPYHLYVGDSKSNVADMWVRGRAWHLHDPERLKALGRATGSKNTWVRGEGNPKAKLTAEQVAAIRQSREKTKALVAFYGVHRVTIQRIRSGAAWS